MSDPLHPKVAQTEHDILDVIRTRWSPRAFDPNSEITRDELRRLFEAARWAPSSANEQPWRFVVAERRHAAGAFARLLDALHPKNRAWATAAPVLVLVAVRVAFEGNEIDNPMAFYDAGSAVGLLTLQATAINLHVRQVRGFDADVARAACDMPLPFEPAVVMAIGRAGDPSTLALEPQRLAEVAPRARRPVSEFVFDDTWGRPF